MGEGEGEGAVRGQDSLGGRCRFPQGVRQVTRLLLCLLAVPLAIGKGRNPLLWFALVMLSPWTFIILVLNKAKPMKAIYLPKPLMDRLTKKAVDAEIAKLETQFK